MAPPDSPKTTSGDSLSSWPALIMFRLGYLQRTCDLILARVTAKPTEPTSTEHKSGLRAWWGWIKETITLANILRNIVQMAWRGGWVGAFVEGFRWLFRWFGGH